MTVLVIFTDVLIDWLIDWLIDKDGLIDIYFDYWPSNVSFYKIIKQMKDYPVKDSAIQYHFCKKVFAL